MKKHWDSELDLILESISSYRKPHPLDDCIEVVVRTPQTLELVFPQGKHVELEKPEIKLIILAIEDLIELCEDLSKQI